MSFGPVFKFVLCVAICGILNPAVCLANWQDDATHSNQLRVNFVDDFDQNSLRDYAINPKATWEPGKLVLAPTATLSRKIDGGCWAEVEIDFEFPRLEGRQTVSKFELRLDMFPKNDLKVVWTSRLEGEQVIRQVALLGSSGVNPLRRFLPVVEEVGHWSLQEGLGSKWRVSYRYGLVQIKCLASETAEEWSTLAFLDKGLSQVDGFTLRGPRSRLQIMALAAHSTSSAPTPSDEQRGQIWESKSANSKFITLFNEGRLEEAVEYGRKALELCKAAYGEEHAETSACLGNLGHVLEELGRYQQAKPLLSEACEIDRKIVGELHPQYANSLNSLAALYIALAEFDKAEALIIQSRDIFRQVLGEDDPSFANSLNSLASLYHDLGRLQEAETLYQQALDILLRVFGPRDPMYALGLSNLALVHESAGNFGKAEALHRQALEVREQVLGKEHPSYAVSLNNLAGILGHKGEYAEAERLYLAAQAIERKVFGREHPAYATSLNNLASLYASMGKYSESVTLHIEALEIRKLVLGADHPTIASSLSNLAGLYVELGDFARAERLYIEAKGLTSRAIGTQHLDYAITVNNLALLYVELGEFTKAKPLLIEALDILQATLGTEHPQYASVLSNLAGLYLDTQEYEQSQMLFVEAEQIHKRTLGPESRDYATTLHNLATVYRLKREFAKAEPLYEQSREILVKLLGEDHPACVGTLDNLAGFYLDMGDYARAESMFVEATELQARILGDDHPVYATSLNNLALAYRAQNLHNKAAKLDPRAIQAKVDVAQNVVPTLSYAQAMIWLGKNRPSIDLALHTLRNLEPLDDEAAYAAVWHTKALTSRLSLSQTIPPNASPEARTLFDELRVARLALAKLVTARPNPGQTEVYRKALAEANDRKESLERSLAEVSPMTERALAIRDSSVDDLRNQLPSGVAVVDLVLLSDVKWVNTEIEVPDEDGGVATRLVKRFNRIPVYEAFVLRSAQDADANSIRWIQLGQAQPIDAAIDAWREQLSRGNGVRGIEGESVPRETLGVDDDVSAVLRRLVWSKLEVEVADCHTVILLPDGHLNRLPWAALPGREPGSFLIEDYALATAAYGQQLFGLLSDDPVQAQRLMLAGGIDYDQQANRSRTGGEAAPLNAVADQGGTRRQEIRQVWPFLDGAAAESRQVHQLWPAQRESLLLSGSEAGETSLSQSLPTSRYAHIATHGFFSAASGDNVFAIDLRRQSLLIHDDRTNSRQDTVAGRNPLLLSGLVLSGANNEPIKDALGFPQSDDGILTAEEIVGLNLRQTELVTLSACETGLGDVAAGEGVFGLQRAFHQAGARSVVASLWKVDDEATRSLMVEFYKNLWQKKLGKLESLRQAQLAMIRAYDPSSGVLRGLGNQSTEIKVKPNSNGQLNPFYWASFQLSGDWR